MNENQTISNSEYSVVEHGALLGSNLEDKLCYGV